MTRCTLALLLLAGSACGGPSETSTATAPPPVETPADEPGDEQATADDTPDVEPARAGAAEGGVGNVSARCQELVGGSGRPETCVVDALVDNASCEELPELVECLRQVSPEAAQREHAQVLAESCP